jgi:hypothetical protein
MRDVVTAAIALVLAAISFFIIPNSWNPSARTLGSAAIAVGFYLIVLMAVKLSAPFGRWFAAKLIGVLVFGLRQWATESRSLTEKDTVWNWLTDQLLVAQGRYAFSVSCIAFARGNDGSLRCLLVKRKFAQFGEAQVWMWPGGRFRGSTGSIEKELRRLVHAETGCTVDLMRGSGTLVRGGFSEVIATYNQETGRTDLENELVGSPLIVMQQNRPQRYDIPGHIDLIYLARVREGQTVSGDAALFSLRGIETFHESQLWSDTKECIRRAAEEFDALTGSSQQAKR